MTKKDYFIRYFAFLIMLIGISIITFIRLVPIIDETWTLNSVINITNGLLPYRDFNLVTTPLYYFLSAIFVSITKNIYGLRFFTILIEFTGCIFTYKIFKKTGINENRAVLLTFFNAFIFSFNPIDYNLLNQVLLIIGLYLVISENNIKNNILLGIIISSMILTKQSTGVLFGFIIFICFCLYNKVKKENIIAIISTCIVLAIVFVLYLLLTNSFAMFLDMCVFGVGNFNTSVTFFIFLTSEKVDISEKITLLTIIVVPLLISIISLIKTKFKNKLILIILLTQLVTLSVLYPIFNVGHFFYILAIDVISTVVVLNNFKTKKETKHPLFKFILTSIVFSFYVAIFLFNSQDVTILSSSIFGNLKVSSENYNKYKEMIEYEKKHSETNFYSPESPYVFIQLESGRSVSGYYECFCNGNFGTKDPVEIMKEAPEKSIFYVFKDPGDVFWQTPFKARQYIIDNFTYKETVGNFDLYEN